MNIRFSLITVDVVRAYNAVRGKPFFLCWRSLLVTLMRCGAYKSANKSSEKRREKPFKNHATIIIPSLFLQKLSTVFWAIGISTVFGWQEIVRAVVQQQKKFLRGHSSMIFKLLGAMISTLMLLHEQKPFKVMEFSICTGSSIQLEFFSFWGPTPLARGKVRKKVATKYCHDSTSAHHSIKNGPTLALRSNQMHQILTRIL